MNRQDGPLWVGAEDQDTPGKIVPLLRNAAGELIVTSGGALGQDVNLISVGGDAIALGETTMASSLPVVIASDQTPIPITGSISATNPSVDTVGGAVPTDATFVGFRDSTGNLEPVVLEADGSLPVTVVAGGGANASVAATGAAVPASATYIGVNVGGNLTGAAAGHGTAAGALRVELPTDGTGVIATVGAVTAVTSVTNPVTVVQPTGTSLHAVIDTGSTTAVTGNVTVVQPTGTNLHTVVDSGTITTVSTVTAVTSITNPVTVAQSTATSLKAEVIGAGTAGTANAGVVTVQGIASMTPVQVSQATAANLNAQVAGDVAHDTADSGNPVKIGGFGADMGVTPTAVTASDRTRFIADRSGVQFVVGGHPNVLTLEAEYAASAQTNTALVSVSSGTCIVVTQIQVVSDEATTVGVGFRIGFGASTTPTTTGVVLTHPGIVPGSGVSRGDGSGILGVGASDEDLRITSESATSGAIRVLVTYYTIAIG